MIALPMNVGTKNFLNGILKCPHVIPAKSNNGFGIDAHNKIVMKPYLSIFSNIRILAFSINVKLAFCFKC